MAAAVVLGLAAAALWLLSPVADAGGGTPEAAIVWPMSSAPAHARRQPPDGGTPTATVSKQTLARAIGAKIMTGMDGTYPSPALLGRIRNGEVGGVILMGANVSPRLSSAVAALQRAATSGGHPPLVIATDQEGGEVRRLPSAPPFQSPATMSGNIQRQGRLTAAALRADRINTDLAPVADVLHPGSFIGSRSFGSQPAAVARKACEFGMGLQSDGVNATFKHFPGLGDAMTNTDLQATTVQASARTLLGDLQPYRSCQPRLVMVSNASYPALGSDGPAVFSGKIVTGLLRHQLGFRGVTISDTLGAPEIAGPDAVVRASKAGVDMLLYTDESGPVLAYKELVRAVEDHKLSASAVGESAARVRALAENPGG